MRPRCSEFLPLASQQLRVRNLRSIHGYNLLDDAVKDLDALVYYSLHSTASSEAFYTSELLPLRHTQQKWAEIQQTSPMQKSNANCVCIKVWKRLSREQQAIEEHRAGNEAEEKKTPPVTPKEPISALTKELLNSSLSPHNLLRPPDKLLFSWGVYFSGLVQLGENTRCKRNSLVFQINGDFFASPDRIDVSHIAEDQLQHQQRMSMSMPRHNKLPSSSSSDVRSNSSFLYNSSAACRSLKPQMTAAAMKDLDLVSKAKKRFTQCWCAAEEVRKSYNLQLLLRIQNIQRVQMKYRQETEEFSQDIKRCSLHCITEQQLMTKRRTKSSSLSLHQHHHGSMGRTLSVLLAEEEQIDPHSLYRARNLLEQIETVRSRHRLLEKEFNTCSARIEVLRHRLKTLKLSREQDEDTLRERRDTLQRDTEQLDQLLKGIVVLQRRKRLTMQNVERRMAALCLELREIYPIQQTPEGLYTLCDIPFPSMCVYFGNLSANSMNVDNISAIALSAVLGYVAHLVQMIAVIINRPLRNPIVYEGSKTRIIDMVRNLPRGIREFPLYSRSSILSQPVKYASFLLEQNIAQIFYDISGHRCHFTAIIDNILGIFKVFADIEEHTRDLHVHKDSLTHPSHRLRLVSSTVHHQHQRHSHGRSQGDHPGNQRDHTEISSRGSDITDFPVEHHAAVNDSYDCLSKSHSSIDMHQDVLLMPPRSTDGPKSMVYLQMPTAPGTVSQPMAIGVRGMGQRICRSVGSYSDSEDDKDGFEHVYSNSDSNIQFQSDPI